MAKVTFHKANNAEWIWTVQSENYETIGSSSESYHNKQDCIDNFTMLTGMHVQEFGQDLKNLSYRAQGFNRDDWGVVFEN